MPLSLPRVLLVVFGGFGLAPVLVAAAALLGLGMVRSVNPLVLATSCTLLLALPMLGLWVLAGRGPPGVVAATWGWPVLLLAGLPGYFPGEVGDALSTGFAVLAAPAGPEITGLGARAGRSLGDVLGLLPQGKPPPPPASTPEPACPPPSIVSSGDQVALPYEGQGHSLTIPVSFNDEDFPMLFDTGATVSTLTSQALRKLGVTPREDAPVVTLRTANGPRDTRLVLIDDVWIGGFQVRGVTVGVCDECGDEKSAGLLGLNVSGQFLVTLDTARKEVVLAERGVVTDRLLDVGPWLDVEARASVFPDERVEVTVSVHNRANRPVQQARVGVRCGEQTYVVELDGVAPLETAEEVASLPRGARCERYRVQLEGARW